MGEEHVAFNWTLFSPFLVLESDPSVGQCCRGCTVAMIKEHDEASSVPLDGHVTVPAAAAQLILMTTLLKCGSQMTEGRAGGSSGAKKLGCLAPGEVVRGGRGVLGWDYLNASSTMSLITTLR